MKYNINEILKDDDAVLWVNRAHYYYVSNIKPSFRQLRIDMLGKVSPKFDPARIEQNIIDREGNIRLLGIYIFNSSDKKITNAEKFISHLRNLLIENPYKDKYKLIELSIDLNIELFELTNLVRELSESNIFQLAFTYGDNNSIEEIIVSDYYFDKIINYVSITNILDELIESHIKSSDVYSKLFQEFDDLTNSTNIQHNTAFIIMPMNPDKAELIDVRNTIKEICSLFSISAYRIDDYEHSGLINQLILDKIKQSEFIIADLTDERPNVYYEIGYAQAINKRPILIRKSGTKLHFDLSVHNVPEYSNISSLKKILYKRLEAITGSSPPFKNELF